MATLDSSLVNVGLQTISRALHASVATAQWLSSGYLVAFAAGLPMNAWLSRRIGPGRLWLTALAAFVASSALCAAAPNLAVLLTLRVVQGLAGALLVPTGQTIIGQSVGPERMGRTLNITKIVVVLAPAVGPTVGGLLLSGLSWRWLFLVNIPIGVLVLVLAMRLVPRGVPLRGQRFDTLGFALIVIGLPLLLYGMTRIGRVGSVVDPSVLGPVVLGLSAVVLFGRRSLAIAHPLLDLRLFANRVYTAAAASVFFTGAALLGTLILLPLYYQQLRGESVLATGLLMLAVGGGTAVSMPFGGALTDRVGGGSISMTGLALSAASVLPLTFLPAAASLPLVAALQAVTGFGLGLAALPALSVAYKTVPRESLADATAEANIIRRVGGAGGTALLVVLLERAGAHTPHAFHVTFGWLAVLCCIALVLAGWLTLEEARSHRGGTGVRPTSCAPAERRRPTAPSAVDPRRSAAR